MRQVNAVNCNTSWKVTLFMKFSDYREDVLKGVWCFIACSSSRNVRTDVPTVRANSM